MTSASTDKKNKVGYRHGTNRENPHGNHIYLIVQDNVTVMCCELRSYEGANDEEQKGVGSRRRSKHAKQWACKLRPRPDLTRRKENGPRRPRSHDDGYSPEADFHKCLHKLV